VLSANCRHRVNHYPEVCKLTIALLWAMSSVLQIDVRNDRPYFCTLQWRSHVSARNDDSLPKIGEATHGMTIDHSRHLVGTSKAILWSIMDSSCFISCLFIRISIYFYCLLFSCEKKILTLTFVFFPSTQAPLYYPSPSQ